MVVAGHRLRQRELGLPVHTGVRVEKRTECRESRERVVPFAEICGSPGGKGKDIVPGRAALVEHDELLRIADGKRAQEHGVGDGKNRRVRTDAKRERQHRDRRKERIAAEDAECVANVATEVGQHDHSPGQVSGRLESFVE